MGSGPVFGGASLGGSLQLSLHFSLPFPFPTGEDEKEGEREGDEGPHFLWMLLPQPLCAPPPQLDFHAMEQAILKADLFPIPSYPSSPSQRSNPEAALLVISLDPPSHPPMLSPSWISAFGSFLPASSSSPLPPLKPPWPACSDPPSNPLGMILGCSLPPSPWTPDGICLIPKQWGEDGGRCWLQRPFWAKDLPGARAFLFSWVGARMHLPLRILSFQGSPPLHKSPPFSLSLLHIFLQHFAICQH